MRNIGKHQMSVLNSLGNIFASREANFVSATKDSTGGQTGKHLRKHRESQMFPQQCFLVCPGLNSCLLVQVQKQKLYRRPFQQHPSYFVRQCWVKILNKSSANFTEDINTIQTPGLDKDVFLFNLLHPSHPNHFKDDVHSVLRISSAHNKGGPPDINIA